MRSLTLLRHAEAAEPEADQDDHDRPLTAAGREAAEAVGRVTADNPPDLVLCSTSLRTRETLAAATPSWTAAPKISYDAALYLASARKLLSQIRAVDGDPKHLWVIGHNPGLFDLATMLGGANGRRSYPDLWRRFPTASRAVFEIDHSSWREIDPDRLKLTGYFNGKELLKAM